MSEKVSILESKYKGMSKDDLRKEMLKIKALLREQNEIITSINVQAAKLKDSNNKDLLIKTLDKKRYVVSHFHKLQAESDFLRNKLKPHAAFFKERPYLLLGYQYSKMKEFIVNEYGEDKFAQIINNKNDSVLYEFFNDVLRYSQENNLKNSNNEN